MINPESEINTNYQIFKPSSPPTGFPLGGRNDKSGIDSRSEAGMTDEYYQCQILPIIMSNTTNNSIS